MAIVSEIRKALKSLVCKGRVSVSEIAKERYFVTLNGKYFGVYDAVRHTFVD